MFKLDGESVIFPLLLGVCVGALLTFPFAAPIFGAKLPETAATLWGAALGSMLAVFGALMVSAIAEKNKRKDAVALILEMVEPIAFYLEALRKNYGLPTHREDYLDVDREPDLLDPINWFHIKSDAKNILTRIELLQTRTHRIDAVLPILGADVLDAYFDVETSLEVIQRNVEKIQDRAKRDYVQLYPDHPSWSQRWLLDLHATDIRTSVNKLRRLSH